MLIPAYFTVLKIVCFLVCGKEKNDEPKAKCKASAKGKPSTRAKGKATAKGKASEKGKASSSAKKPKEFEGEAPSSSMKRPASAVKRETAPAPGRLLSEV